MKICQQCQQSNPSSALFGMHCGRRLQDVEPDPDHGRATSGSGSRWLTFWMTLAGSVILSWFLITVLHLPVLIIGAVLPLLWFSRK